MTVTNFLLGLIFVLCGFTAWMLNRKSTTGTDDKKSQELGELKNQISKLTTERDELAGKGKEQFASFKNLEAEYKASIKESDIFKKQIARYEAETTQREKQQQDHAEKLNAAKEALEDERVRIRREDEERQKQILEERDRIWGNHEEDVKSRLQETCKRLQFSFYDNKNLPTDYHGKLKPDNMVEFLTQYIIFDAKCSKSDKIDTYIKDAVKKTALKVKGDQQIFSTVFLVIPTLAVSDLKQTSFYEEGITFHVIPPEAIAPILTCFKKMSEYEFAEAMDPQKRENIIDMIAQFNYHVSARNAVDLELIKHGLETLSKAERLDPEIVKEAIVKKAKMRALNLSAADQKRLTSNPDEMAYEIDELVDPSPKISNEDREIARKGLSKKK